MSAEPRWVERQTLLILHEDSLKRFGGSHSIRDEGLLESALARQQNKFLYEPETTIYRLAAAYCFGIAKNHPFIDGNKRSALQAMGLFLLLNRFSLVADPLEVERVVLEVVTDGMDEDELAKWPATNCVDESGEGDSYLDS